MYIYMLRGKFSFRETRQSTKPQGWTQMHLKYGMTKYYVKKDWCIWSLSSLTKKKKKEK